MMALWTARNYITLININFSRKSACQICLEREIARIIYSSPVASGLASWWSSWKEQMERLLIRMSGQKVCEDTSMNGPVNMHLRGFLKNAHPSIRKDFLIAKWTRKPFWFTVSVWLFSAILTTAQWAPERWSLCLSSNIWASPLQKAYHARCRQQRSVGRTQWETIPRGTNQPPRSRVITLEMPS